MATLAEPIAEPKIEAPAPYPVLSQPVNGNILLGRDRVVMTTPRIGQSLIGDDVSVELDGVPVKGFVKSIEVQYNPPNQIATMTSVGVGLYPYWRTNGATNSAVETGNGWTPISGQIQIAIAQEQTVTVKFFGTEAALNGKVLRITSSNVQNNWVNAYYNPANFISKESLFREKMKTNLLPVMKHREIWGAKLTVEEYRARTLLHDLVGDQEFKRFLKRGFIMVKGRSGTLYKITGGYSMVVSYIKNDKGKYVPYERFCVQFKCYDLPFTDGVIMRKLLVENDEFALRKAANVSKVSPENVNFGGGVMNVGVDRIAMAG